MNNVKDIQVVEVPSPTAPRMMPNVKDTLLSLPKMSIDSFSPVTREHSALQIMHGSNKYSNRMLISKPFPKRVTIGKNQ